MPKRTDIKNILIIGSGPIVIGQGCEFDYSGTQACKALREEGYSIVLINSNPATIMTDPGTADRTYIEPITPEFIEKILIREQEDGRPVHALLPTLGGQTGLNCAMEVAERGILAEHGVEMIGACAEAIHKAEDRTAFKETMTGIGLEVPLSGVAHSWEEAREIIERVKLPCCVRPAYTLGGEGGGFCRSTEEFETICKRGLRYSRVSEVLIERDLYGWKEFELEVMRDRADNVVIICSIENVDPMGVHTGDSITVAPAQTLSDKEYQKMRDGAIAVIRAIGVDTGGCNIQFAVDPTTGRQCVIEMNPRVSRSSALASKATGYPIARIAAKLAVGYTLDELPNDITKTTPASFEPTIDYVVVKMPRWSFEKFPDSDETLTTQMKSVGEAMAIGRTFKEAFQKCIRSMEIKRYGFGLDGNDVWLTEKRRSDVATRRRRKSSDKDDPPSIVLGGSTASEAPPDTEEEHARAWPIPEDVLHDKLTGPCQGRPYYIRYAMKMGWSIERIYELTRIDPWFLDQMRDLVDFESSGLPVGVVKGGKDGSGSERSRAKSLGYSEIQLANASSETVVVTGHSRSSEPVYKLVDTCAAEFEAGTPYYYSSHESCALDAGGREFIDDEIRVSDKPKIVVLGGGPNRIGQGIEFDYCCCHASFAARQAEYESVMINSNPETVSTDFDTSDMLFFEPLTQEDVLNICQRLNRSPLHDLPPLQDFTGCRDQPSVANGDLNTFGWSLPDAVFDQMVRTVEEKGLAPAGVVGVWAMPPAMKKNICRGYDVMDGRGRFWRFGFNPGKNPELLSVLEESADDCLPYLDQQVVDLARRSLRASAGLLRGVIVQFGGQTPLNLAQSLKDAGAPIIGTQPEMIHAAEDRDAFQKVLRELSLLQPPNGVARGRREAMEVARRIGYPVLVRPSYVLGGRGMRICNNEADLEAYINEAMDATDRADSTEDNPILIDKFLSDAIEVDVDAVADYGPVRADGRCGKPGMCMVAGIMEHIEEAGVHSGDSTCVLPPFSIGRMVVEELFRSTRRLAEKLQVCGAMNVQYAILNRTVYVLEVNPRAARTLPFVAKATGVPWARIATRVMLGEPLADVLASHRVTETPRPRHTSIKAPVFPFEKFAGVDVVLGPEMRSTGEVMAISTTFGRAFAKAQIATGLSLPTSGNVLISVNDPDKPRIVSIARDLHDLGFNIFSTVGTRNILAESGIPATLVSKSSETGAPFLKDLIADGTLDLLINTPIRTGPASDEGRWRAAAALRRVPLITTLAGAVAAVAAIRAMSRSEDGSLATPLEVRPLQSYFAK